MSTPPLRRLFAAAAAPGVEEERAVARLEKRVEGREAEAEAEEPPFSPAGREPADEEPIDCEAEQLVVRGERAYGHGPWAGHGHARAAQPYARGKARARHGRREGPHLTDAAPGRGVRREAR